MPVISAQDRPAPVADEASWRAPKKTIHASTGMDLKQSVSGAPQTPENRQVETPVETKPEPKEVTLSPQLTALARKEAALRQREQAFKAREAEVAAKEAKFAKLANLETKLAAKDYSALDEIGIDYNEYTNYAVAKLNGTDPKDEAIRALEAKVEAIKTANEQNVNKQYEATVNQYKRDIKNLVESNPEFDTVKSMKAEEHVLQHILDTFNEEGEILSVEQAAKDIEEYLLEEALRFAQLKKVQDRLKPAAQELQQKTLPPPKQSPRTLTNQIATGTTSAPRNQFQHLSMKERIAQAAARASKS